jgi:hypothetical protein
MALAPYFSGTTPASAATPAVDGSGRFFVNKAVLNQIMDNFINWKFDVSAGGHNLAALGTLTFDTTGGVADGTLSLPGFRFANDLDTGFYRTTANTIEVVCGGASVLKFDSTGIAQAGWTALTLGANWADYGTFSYAAPSARKDKQNNVRIRMAVVPSGGASSTIISAIATQFRPTYTANVKGFNGSTNAPLLLVITPAGACTIVGAWTTGNNLFFSDTYPLD